MVYVIRDNIHVFDMIGKDLWHNCVIRDNIHVFDIIG